MRSKRSSAAEVELAGSQCGASLRRRQQKVRRRRLSRLYSLDATSPSSRRTRIAPSTPRLVPSTTATLVVAALLTLIPGATATATLELPALRERPMTLFYNQPLAAYIVRVRIRSGDVAFRSLEFDESGVLPFQLSAYHSQ